MYLCIRVISGTVEDYEDLRDYPTSRRAARPDHFRLRPRPSRADAHAALSFDSYEILLSRSRSRFPRGHSDSRRAFALVYALGSVPPPRWLDALAEIGVGVTYVSRFTCTFVRYFRRYMHNSQYVRFVFVLRVFEIHHRIAVRDRRVSGGDYLSG